MSIYVARKSVERNMQSSVSKERKSRAERTHLKTRLQSTKSEYILSIHLFTSMASKSGLQSHTKFDLHLQRKSCFVALNLNL